SPAPSTRIYYPCQCPRTPSHYKSLLKLAVLAISKSSPTASLLCTLRVHESAYHQTQPERREGLASLDEIYSFYLFRVLAVPRLSRSFARTKPYTGFRHTQSSPAEVPHWESNFGTHSLT